MTPTKSLAQPDFRLCWPSDTQIENSTNSRKPVRMTVCEKTTSEKAVGTKAGTSIQAPSFE